MKQWMRCFALWLAVALPVHGYAAGTMQTQMALGTGFAQVVAAEASAAPANEDAHADCHAAVLASANETAPVDADHCPCKSCTTCHTQVVQVDAPGFAPSPWRTPSPSFTAAANTSVEPKVELKPPKFLV